MEPGQNLLSAELQVDTIAATHLKETAMWAKLLAVVGLVLSVLIAIVGLFAGTMMATMTKNLGGDSSINALGSGMVTILYLIIGGVYFFLSLFLLRFSVKMKLALLTTDQDNFNASLFNLKLVYRTMGIIMVIYLSFLALALVVGIGAAAFMR